jgi:cellulose biosynthesis protein BcsQ
MQNLPEMGSDFMNLLRARKELPTIDSNIISVLNDWPQETIERYFELCALQVIAAPSETQYIILQESFECLDKILLLRNDKLYVAIQAFYESLILHIDATTKKASDAILKKLAELGNCPEGVLPANDIKNSADVAPRQQVILKNILNTGLIRELEEFLKIKSNIKSVSNDSVTNNVSTRLVSFLSRKGGVGKSSLLLATAFWFVKAYQNKRVCILDLDLSGPVWQYLLFPQPERPEKFLNAILDLEQGDQEGEFTFPQVDKATINDCIEWPELGCDTERIGVITLSDLPRTNRYLSLALKNNPTGYYNFIISILDSLGDFVDLVLIDNAPGFDSTQILSHVLASSIPCGASIVLSTPAAPDLRGTMIELSDLALLKDCRPPLWVVNMATPEAMEFISRPLGITQVASEDESYNSILPINRHIALKAVCSPIKYPSAKWLQRDEKLHSFGHVSTRSIPTMLDDFCKTKLYEGFEKEVAPHLSSLLKLV